MYTHVHTHVRAGVHVHKRVLKRSRAAVVIFKSSRNKVEKKRFTVVCSPCSRIKEKKEQNLLKVEKTITRVAQR